MNAWKKVVRDHVISRFEKSDDSWLEVMRKSCIVLCEKYDVLTKLHSRDLELLSPTAAPPAAPAAPTSLGVLTVEAVYGRVLALLAAADRSGQWPSTSIGILSRLRPHTKGVG